MDTDYGFFRICASERARPVVIEPLSRLKGSYGRYMVGKRWSDAFCAVQEFPLSAPFKADMIAVSSPIIESQLPASDTGI